MVLKRCLVIFLKLVSLNRKAGRVQFKSIGSVCLSCSAISFYFASVGLVPVGVATGSYPKMTCYRLLPVGLVPVGSDEIPFRGTVAPDRGKPDGELFNSLF